jgi:hypothetical protein
VRVLAPGHAHFGYGIQLPADLARLRQFGAQPAYFVRRKHPSLPTVTGRSNSRGPSSNPVLRLRPRPCDLDRTSAVDARQATPGQRRADEEGRQAARLHRFAPEGRLQVELSPQADTQDRGTPTRSAVGKPALAQQGPRSDLKQRTQFLAKFLVERYFFGRHAKRGRIVVSRTA